MKKALVIGIDDYDNQPLSSCVNDANRISTLLARHADGTKNFDVNLITQKENSTIDKLKREVRSLFETEADVALLYFSGHGMVTPEGGVVVASDWKLGSEGVEMNTLITHANRSVAKDKIIVLDCCNAGQCGHNLAATQTIAVGKGVTILAACDDNEYAIGGGEHSLFTELLVDSLTGYASDLLGNTTPGSIYAYIDHALGAWEQRPVFRTNVHRFTSLRKTKPQIALPILINLTKYFPDPSLDYPLDPSFEDTEANADPENVKIFKELQTMVSAGLIKPVDEEHMYYAAMNSKSCKLTALGKRYWALVNNDRL